MNRSFSRRLSSSKKPEAIALPAADLDPVTSTAAEDVRARREWIQAQGLFRQQRQAVDDQAEVHQLAVQVDLQAFVEAKHRSLPSTVIASPTWRGSMPRSSIPTPLAGVPAGVHCDEHSERYLLEFVYAHLNEHDLLRVNTDAGKYLLLATFNLVESIAFVGATAAFS